MINFSQTAVINAPVEKVFSTIADPHKIPQWRKDVPAISNISGVTNTGTTFSEEVVFMGKKRLIMKVTEFIPNKKLVIEAQEGMQLLPTQYFDFIHNGNKTQINLSVRMEIKGPFKLIQFMLPGKLKKSWKGYFENLNKLLAES